MLTDIVVKKLAPYDKRCDLYRSNKHTHTHTHTDRHTHSEETEESLFYFSVVVLYILLGSKISGFQKNILYGCNLCDRLCLND